MNPLDQALAHLDQANGKLNGPLVRDCDRCGEIASAVERGNGQANLCPACCGDGEGVTARESAEMDAQEKVLAQLGARVLEILPRDGASATARLCALQDIDAAARSLGLLGEEANL